MPDLSTPLERSAQLLALRSCEALQSLERIDLQLQYFSVLRRALLPGNHPRSAEWQRQLRTL
jgi:hypothetical protein